MKAAENENIHRILKGIIDKWRATGATETAAAGPGEEDDMMETVILSPAGMVSPLMNGDESTETVVLSARSGITNPKPSSLSPPDLGREAALETVVLGAGDAKTGPPTSARLNEDEFTELETIIIFPGMYPKGTFGTKNNRVSGAAGELKEETESGDAMSETVVLTPRRTNVKAKRWRDY